MVFTGRRKSWAMKSARSTAFDSFQESRSSSFSLSRRSVNGSGPLNTPQVVQSVTPEGNPTSAEEQRGSGKRNNRRHRWFPFPRIHIPFFSRGTKNEQRDSQDGDSPFQTYNPAPFRHSADVAGFRNRNPQPMLQQPGSNTANTGVSGRIPGDPMRGVDNRSSSVRNPQDHDQEENWPPSPSQNSQHVFRAGSLDFWQASMNLAGLYPQGDPGPDNWTAGGSSQTSRSGLPPLMNHRNGHPAFSDHVQQNLPPGQRNTPRSHGRSCSASSLQSRNQESQVPHVNLSPMDIDQMSSRRPSSAFLGSRVGSYESFHDWQQRAIRHADHSARAPLSFDVSTPAVLVERGQNMDQNPASHRLPAASMETNQRISIDSFCQTSGQRTPFGSFIEDVGMSDDRHGTSGRMGATLEPIALYSEIEAVNQAHYAAYGTPYPGGGGYDPGFAHHAHMNPPPAPPAGSSYVSDAMIYHRSLFFEQLVLRDPHEPEEDTQGSAPAHQSFHQDYLHHPIPPPTEHPDDMVDYPDYPTTIHSLSNRSCQDQMRHHHPDGDGQDDMTEVGSNTFKAWLDELEERGEYRRKECTYRIACQRTFMKQMKDKLQTSKLAFNRLKLGLGPDLTDKVSELRTRFSSQRRLRAIENRRQQYEEEQWDLWAGPMLDLELELGYESDSSWISAENELQVA